MSSVSMTGRVTADNESDRAKLEELGVIIGPEVTVHEKGVHRYVTFEDCTVSDAALDKLNPLWGEYIWGLT